MALTVGRLLHWPETLGSATDIEPAGITAGQEARSRLDCNPDSAYVYNYMLGRSYELHVGVGDSRPPFGVSGLVVAVVVA